jgi:hypothetical protein
MQSAWCALLHDIDLMPPRRPRPSEGVSRRRKDLF